MIVIAARRVVEYSDTSVGTRSCHPTEFLLVLSQIYVRPVQ